MSKYRGKRRKVISARPVESDARAYYRIQIRFDCGHWRVVAYNPNTSKHGVEESYGYCLDCM